MREYNFGTGASFQDFLNFREMTQAQYNKNNGRFQNNWFLGKNCSELKDIFPRLVNEWIHLYV